MKETILRRLTTRTARARANKKVERAKHQVPMWRRRAILAASAGMRKIGQFASTTTCLPAAKLHLEEAAAKAGMFVSKLDASRPMLIVMFMLQMGRNRTSDYSQTVHTVATMILMQLCLRYSAEPLVSVPR